MAIIMNKKNIFGFMITVLFIFIASFFYYLSTYDLYSKPILLLSVDSFTDNPDHIRIYDINTGATGVNGIQVRRLIKENEEKEIVLANFKDATLNNYRVERCSLELNLTTPDGFLYPSLDTCTNRKSISKIE